MDRILLERGAYSEMNRAALAHRKVNSSAGQRSFQPCEPIMPQAQQIIFVLWGTYCYENVATTFVAEMRSAGLLLKVVGLGGRPLCGLYGLALVPDLTLGQALPLARQARCIVIPCDAQTFRRFHNDPRLKAFLTDAEANHAHFVLQDELMIDEIQKIRPDPKRTAEGNSKIVSSISTSIYPTGPALIPFAQSLAQSLLTE